MPISVTLSSTNQTAQAKISDAKAIIDAVNAELALYATKSQMDALAARVKALEDAAVNMASKADLTPYRDFDLALEERVNDRLAALESSPVLSDLGVIIAGLEGRIDALETRPAPTTSPTTGAGNYERPARPSGLRTDEVSLVYDRATLYYRDMELYADRIGERRWRLYAQLNYFTITPAVWTYDEIVEGTAEEVYAHAVERLEELAELKPQHDAVHERVNRMSEGTA